MITLLVVIVVSLVAAIPISLLIVEVTSRIDRRIRRKVTAAASTPVRDAIRAELDQTPEWWDQQYRALVEKQIPRDADSHRGHDIEEPITFWSGDQIGPRCLDCGVTIERPPDG